MPGLTVTRILLLILGWTFLALGIVGAFLPLLPTTPFLILSLWAFSRSSQRLHDWLYHHRLLGPRLQDWRANRVIPLRVKLTAWGAMAASLAYATFVTRAPWPLLLGMAVVMLIGVVYVARCPSRPPAKR